jgi:two-component system response regulator HydG
MQPRMLIVDDDAEMREALGILFSREGHSCELAADATTALELVHHRTFDVVVSDVIMQGMDGLELLDRIKLSHPALPVVIITGAGRVPQAVDAIKRGAFGYAVKPCDADELQRIVASALDAREHPSESARVAPARDSVGDLDLVGQGPAMRRLQTTIDNTSAIPQELLEGELFGHARGGFTGAIQARKGLLTEADGGTLLLDEIGDMSFGLQAKLLRVLQFGDVRPVGSDRVHHVDVRVIASTHRDLPALVKEGRFREDLLFRLDVLSVAVPPLRDHREDIPALAAHFLAKACQRAPQSPVRAIGQDTLRALAERSWPGNVRELASSIERAVVFGVDEMLDVNQLSPSPNEAPVSGWPFPSDAPWTLQRLSRTYADWVLERSGGDKQRAAAVLGVDLSTLYRWRRKRPD